MKGQPGGTEGYGIDYLDTGEPSTEVEAINTSKTDEQDIEENLVRIMQSQTQSFLEEYDQLDDIGEVELNSRPRVSFNREYIA